MRIGIAPQLVADRLQGVGRQLFERQQRRQPHATVAGAVERDVGEPFEHPFLVRRAEEDPGGAGGGHGHGGLWSVEAAEDRLERARIADGAERTQGGGPARQGGGGQRGDEPLDGARPDDRQARDRRLAVHLTIGGEILEELADLPRRRGLDDHGV